jgi:FkbM family methyltransferase
MAGPARVGGRSLGTIAQAPLQLRHYRAVLNMFRICRQPVRVLQRYLSGRGAYPWDLDLRTPLGILTPRLFSHADLLTVNEIFCRLDYFVDDTPKVIVDVGSNIGLSALYFLTRHPQNRCYLFEPVPENVGRLQRNLESFQARYTVEQNAVADVEGMVEVGVEPTGRYGGIDVRSDSSIRVQCRSINSVLDQVLRHEGRIDVIKLDTEGAELRTVRAIDAQYLDSIGALFLEARPQAPLLPGFKQEQYGGVVRLYNERW